MSYLARCRRAQRAQILANTCLAILTWQAVDGPNTPIYSKNGSLHTAFPTWQAVEGCRRPQDASKALRDDIADACRHFHEPGGHESGGDPVGRMGNQL